MTIDCWELDQPDKYGHTHNATLNDWTPSGGGGKKSQQVDNTQDDEDFEIVINGNASPFYDSKTDILAGYAINFQVLTPYLHNTCVVPV